MLGRRVAVLVQPARLSALTPLRQCPHDSSTRVFLLYHSRRSYATPSRPRKAVGEPSRPVKRAVKRSAAVADAPESAAKQLVEAKKKKAAAKPKATTKTAGADEKEGAVKSKAVRVRKPKPVVELTAEEEATKAANEATKAAATEARNVKQTAKKDRLEARAVKAKARKTAQASKEKAAKNVAHLEETALSPPKVRPRSAYLAFFIEQGAGLKGQSGDSRAAVKERVSEHGKRVGALWRDMAAADIEHYNHLSQTLYADSLAAYKSWVTSHPPSQILAANRARASLRRLQPAKPNHHPLWPRIDDEREPKGPVGAFALFSVQRHASGDLKHIKLAEASKLIAQEWKELDEGEKEKYKSLQAQDSKRYHEEFEGVYGHLPGAAQAKDATTASTTATEEPAAAASEEDAPVAASASA